MGEKCSDKFRLESEFQVILGIFYMPQIYSTDGFTSPPKEGVLRTFSPLKIRRLRPGLNPRTWVPKATSRSPKPLLHPPTTIYINEDKIFPNTDNFMISAILHFYNFTLVIDTTVQNNDEISLHFKPMRLIFMNYSVYLPQILLFTCDLMMAW